MIKEAGIWMMIVTLFILPVIQSQDASEAAGREQSEMIAAFNSEVKLARFFNNDPDTVLWASNSGIELLNIRTNQMMDKILSEEKIRALKVDPFNSKKAIASTISGRVYFIELKDGKLVPQLVQELSQGDVHIIRQFLFHPQKPGFVYAADSNTIYCSKDNGLSWMQNMPIKIPEEERIIIVMIPSIAHEDKFLVSTTQGGRYLIDWEFTSLEEVVESAIPHGHSIGTNTRSYILKGPNEQIFGFKHLDIQMLDGLYFFDQQNGPVIYGAGIGTSPIKWQKKGHRIFVYHICPRLHMTFSIDVFPSDQTRIILTDPNGIFVTENAGKDWVRIK
ncbi:hypothetical protein JW979_03500 [bacterium]|nr:hypothetical protein [candidate division CSSED10-310 bacterium]